MRWTSSCSGGPTRIASGLSLRRSPARGVDSATLATGAQGLPKAYKMVRTDSTMTTAPYDGAVAWWADQALYKTTTSPTTLRRGRGAGVFRTVVTGGNA